MMNTKHKFATEVYPKVAEADAMIGIEKAYAFHTAFGMPVREGWTDSIPVGERLLRGKLLIEEVLETLNAMGLRLTGQVNQHDGTLGDIGVEHVEGSLYDPVETADGLADIKVICNGTAVAFGIPQDEVDLEVFCSNMTKLNAESGLPIVNRCIACDPKYVKAADVTHCEDAHHQTHAWIDPSKPLGKVLKPDTYTPANIAGLRESFLADNLRESCLAAKMF